MTKNMTRILCLSLVTLITISAITFRGVSANPATKVSVDPTSIINQALIPGSVFTIIVNISDVADLFGWQVKLLFNPAVINVSKGALPPDHVFAGQTYIQLGPTIDNIGGSVTMGATLLAGGTTFTGNGKLAKIDFKVKSTGSTSISFDLTNTKLRDSTAAPISYTAVDGFFDNRPPIPPATMYVDPSKIVNPLLTPSNQFDFNVTIANATDVYSYEFKLGFDPSVLSVVSATLGNFFPSSVIPTVTIDNIGGSMSFSAALTPPQTPKSGNGTLATIRFHVEGIGASALDLNGTKLRDQTGNPLDHSALDGFFNNIKLAKLYVDPSSIIDPTFKPPKIFTINIAIDDIENLYGYEFKLGYNTKMLTAIGILINPVLDETNFNASMSVNDGAGLIWVKVQYYSPATPLTTYTPVSLVTLTFKVDAIGSSVLNLYDTMLTDAGGLPITHEAIDGYVQTLIRDVAIMNVVSSHTWAYKGTPINITVTAKNLGNISETFDVSAYYDSNVIGTKTVSNLPSNSETTLIFAWNTSSVNEGDYTLKATASTVPYEFNLANNVFVDGTVSIKSLIHDVAIINVKASPTLVYQSEPVNVTVVAKNVGNVTETFDVTAYYNSSTIGKKTVTNLAPNANTTLLFIWDTTGVLAGHNYTISAQASIVPFEVNTANNRFVDGSVKVRIMGDINNDNKVDIDDIVVVAAAFGSYPGHPRWNSVADLNKDGIVDITDVVLVAINFGKTA